MSVRDDIIRGIAERVRDTLKQEIEFDGLIFTGQLKNSWEIEYDGNEAVVGSRLIWAKVMNDGRVPGSMPPVKALMPWVFQKLGAQDEEDMKRKAFAVAKKIEKEGIEPRHYVERALFFLEASSR